MSLPTTAPTQTPSTALLASIRPASLQGGPLANTTRTPLVPDLPVNVQPTVGAPLSLVQLYRYAWPAWKRSSRQKQHRLARRQERQAPSGQAWHPDVGFDLYYNVRYRQPAPVPVRYPVRTHL